VTAGPALTLVPTPALTLDPIQVLILDLTPALTLDPIQVLILDLTPAPIPALAAANVGNVSFGPLAVTRCCGPYGSLRSLWHRRRGIARPLAIQDGLRW
jgi:hypothetical protein